LRKQAEEEKEGKKLTLGVDKELLHQQLSDVIDSKINTGIQQCRKEEEQKYKIENRKGMYNENIEHCEE